MASGDALHLSVVIPTRNRSRSLQRALASIRAQALSTTIFEVIVVDNGSTDDTREVCREFRSRLPNLRYRYEAEPGLHAARHAGMRAARSDILVFADDDIEAFPGWLAGIVEAFEAGDAVLVGGKNLPKFESTPPEWLAAMWRIPKPHGLALGYLSILDFGDQAKPIDPVYIWGCNFAIRRQTLMDAGGFHPDSMPEAMLRYRGDGESHVARYVAEKGLGALYQPKAAIFHHVPKQRMSTDYFCRRAYKQGITDSYTHFRRGERPPLLRLHRRRIRRMGRWLVRRRLNDRLRLAHANGYLYHQVAVRKDPQLSAWVTRPDYFTPEA